MDSGTRGRGWSSSRDRPHAFIRNSLANLAGGLSMAVLSLLVPWVLVRYLSPVEFSAWMLIFQLAAYTALLNLGIQGATSRYVAHCLATDDRDSASDIVSTAFLVLIVTAIVAAALTVIICKNFGDLFPTLPMSAMGPAKAGLLLMGLTSAFGMPSEAIAGTFTGVRRSALVATIQGSSRLVLATALITIVTLFHHGVVSMAITFAIVNVVGYLTLWFTNQRLDIVNITPRRANRRSFRLIWSFSGALIVWTVAMFFINGFDVAIVGRLDFASVGLYSVCFGPILLIVGAQQALFSPLLQIGAARSAGGSESTLPSLLLRSTKLSTLLLLSLAVPLLLLSRDLLGWWLGPRYANQAANIFRLLLIGNITRSLATPYAMLLLATLKHGRVLVSPIVEAAINVSVSIVAGLRFGAAGVACGVVAGSLVGQVMLVYMNAPRTMEVIGDLRKLLVKGVAQPIACFLPGLVTAVAPIDRLAAPLRWSIAASAILACVALAWHYSLSADEQGRIRDAAKGKFFAARES